MARKSGNTLARVYQGALQDGLGPLVYVSLHVIERLLERVPKDKMEQTIKVIIRTLKSKLCMIAYESVVAGSPIRVKVNDFRIVCWTDTEAKKLVLKTIY